MASEGASNLAAELDIRKIKHENSRFKGGPNKKVINWGSTNLPDEVQKCNILNQAEAVRICSDKLRFFNHISGHDISIPDWTTDPQVAMKWVAEGNTVCARQILNGHSAAGLVIMDKNTPDKFVKAPLYTKYVPKQDEYRVHVVNGEVIDVQRKALRPNWAEEHEGKVNWQVRNLDNGFIYVRGDVKPPKTVLDEALKTIARVGLVFGAVDVIYNDKRKQAYVLEVNTAPGITGQTVINYAAAFKKLK